MKTLIDNKLMLAIILMLAIFISGCNKDESNELSKTELLTRQWNVTAIDGQTVVAYSGMDAFIIKFENDGDLKLTVKAGGESLTFAYSWSWKDSENAIVIDDGSYTTEWTVEKLTLEEFWYYDTDEQVVFKCNAI